jgi:hypothetical protein
MKRLCPKCGGGGIKDDACNHITCDSCDYTKYCYWCGEEIDYDNPFSHNEDYETGADWYAARKCPAFNNEIYCYDSNWPSDDAEVQELLIKKRTVKLLREFVEAHGEDRYHELIEKFPRCGEASGYTLDEILNYDIKMIDYGPEPVKEDEEQQ